jgi:hypothetical protein
MTIRIKKRELTFFVPSTLKLSHPEPTTAILGKRHTKWWEDQVLISYCVFQKIPVRIFIW